MKDKLVVSKIKNLFLKPHTILLVNIDLDQKVVCHMQYCEKCEICTTPNIPRCHADFENITSMHKTSLPHPTMQSERVSQPCLLEKLGEKMADLMATVESSASE